MPTSLPVLAILIYALAGVLFAFWKGGTPERLAAACLLANVCGGIAVRELGFGDGLVRFANDGLTALALLAVTMRFARPWMIGLMALYALQFTMHAYYMVVGRDDHDYMHALLNNLNFIGIITCLVAGTVVAWRARVRAPTAAAPSSPVRRR